MRPKSDIVHCLTDPGVIAVLRAPSFDVVAPLAEALVAGGLLAIEITMSTPRALEAIRQTSRQLTPRGCVGVGTVLDASLAQSAIDAGAEFVVTPILRPEIAAVARKADRPVMLGAYTPTEAQLAWEAGADFIKIFPADRGGPEYIRSLRAPLPHLKIVPTGGVDLQTAGEFIRAGCAAVGAGSSLVRSDLVAQGKWAELTALAASFVDAVRQARGQ